jgi:predicted secreted acid phosphatase
MKLHLKLAIALFIFIPPLFAPSLSSQFTSLPPEPENHAIAVDRLIRYHDSGEYDWAIREAADAARDCLDVRIQTRSKEENFGAVFDIDETALSIWQALSGCGFCSYSARTKLYSNAHGPAIEPVLELFNDARKKGIAVFFVTGRRTAEREATIKNLSEAGYSGWTDLVMRPENNNSPARLFKSEERRNIEDSGHHIVLNIGDQASDLAGCCAEKVFKLPKPFHLVQ